MSIAPLPRRLITVMCFALMGLTLGGCDSLREVFVPDTIVYPPYEGEGLAAREPTEKEMLVARGDFSMELVRFEDMRRPRSTALTAPDGVIYEYEPNDLLQGVTYKVPVLMNKYLAWHEKRAKHYKVELELNRLHTRILRGKLWSGNFGRYSVELEARAIVRRPDSRVAVNRLYRFNLEEKRATINGRGPSKEMDRARQYDLTEDAFRRLAEAVAWDIRRIDSRRWDVDEEKGYGRVGAREEPKQMVGAAPDDAPVVMPEDETMFEDEPPTTIEELVGPEKFEEQPPEEEPMIDERPVRG